MGNSSGKLCYVSVLVQNAKASSNWCSESLLHQQCSIITFTLFQPTYCQSYLSALDRKLPYILILSEEDARQMSTLCAPDVHTAWQWPSKVTDRGTEVFRVCITPGMLLTWWSLEFWKFENGIMTKSHLPNLCPVALLLMSPPFSNLRPYLGIVVLCSRWQTVKT